jgi:hypothetical protein
MAIKKDTLDQLLEGRDPQAVRTPIQIRDPARLMLRLWSPEPNSVIVKIYTIEASLRRGRPESTYCGHSRSRASTPHKGGP